MAHEDAPRPSLPRLDWSESQRAASLGTLYEQAHDYGRQTEGWYARKRGSKRSAGRMLRVLAILLTGAAALIPVLSEIFTTDGKPDIAPAWAAIGLGLAATLIALDRFFGFTSAWTRFMVAELHMIQRRHVFEYDWQEAWVGLGDPPSADDTRRLMGIARNYVLALDDEMAKETDAWIREFRSILSRAEQELAAARS